MYLHLDRLKARILAPEVVALTRYDVRLAAIAAEVAALFDSYTGRTLVRASGIIEDHSGGQGFIQLRAVPVETLTTLTISYEDGETHETLDYDRLSKKTGLVYFDDGSPGGEYSTIRATYTGGYYVDTSSGGNGEQPSGSTAMPADLLGAWCLQIDHELRVRRVLGSTGDEDVSAPYPQALDFIPRVKTVLNQYKAQL